MVPLHQGRHCNFVTYIFCQGEEKLLTSAYSAFLCLRTNWNRYNQTLNALWTNWLVFKSVMHAQWAYAMPIFFLTTGPYSYRIKIGSILDSHLLKRDLKECIHQSGRTVYSFGNSEWTIKIASSFCFYLHWYFWLCKELRKFLFLSVHLGLRL